MKDNYEKVLLSVAGLVAIAMIVLGILKLGSVEKDFVSASENSKQAPPIEVEKLVSQASDSISSPLNLVPVKTSAGREVDSFTGVDLFVRKGEQKTVDLLSANEAAVHPPIPNLWWIEYGIDPGFGDSPQRDHDEDGFSNLEEFEARTNPADAESFPSLFAKIKVAKIQKESWYLRFSNFGGGALSFRIEGVQNGKRAKNKMKGGLSISPGKVFFSEGAFSSRFKFVELLNREVKNIPKDFAKIEDLKSGKEGKIYEIASGSHKVLHSDYTAHLYLNTPDQKDNIFKIEEGRSFSLPYDENAAEKPYTFKEIQDNGASILLTWKNKGETKQLKLSAEN